MELRYLSDVKFPDAEKIILVMDNLNTHKPASLYKTFESVQCINDIYHFLIACAAVLWYTNTHEQCAKSNGICITTVSNTIRQYIMQGVGALIVLKRSVNSDNAKRKVDGRAEAKLIEIACGPAPEGHSRCAPIVGGKRQN